MNIGNTIREQRNNLSLSQDDLAERIYVSRQTISSWENGKSYPDIHSLILLSQVFDVTIDNLVKGDLDIMEQKIGKNDVSNLKLYIVLTAIFAVFSIILLSLSLHVDFTLGTVIGVPILAMTFFFAFKAEIIQKKYDVQTYREIVAFCKGETLDEIAKARELKKRKYQYATAFVFGIIAYLSISTILYLIFKVGNY